MIILVVIEFFNEIFIKLTAAGKNDKFNGNFATMRKQLLVAKTPLIHNNIKRKCYYEVMQMVLLTNYT